jgi:hypothetical protein
MAILRGGTEAVRLTGLVFFVGIIREMGVTEFVAQLAVYDLSILNRQDQVVRRASKVLADGAPIIGDSSNLHLVSSGLD